MYEMYNSMSNKFDSYDVIVAGAGIGGLLSAALLSNRGFSVIVFEKLSFIGGRFTSFNFKGYEIPTGAIHMIPNSRGTFAEILKEFGISYKKADLWAELKWKDQRKSCKHMFGFIKTLKSTSARLALIKIIFKSMMPPKDHAMSFDEYLESQTQNEELHQFFEAFVNFSLSLSLKDISAKKMLEIGRKVILLGGPIIPIGGCKGVIKELEKIILENNGKIITNADIQEICVSEEKAEGIIVKTGKELFKVKGKYLISNLGPKKTYEKIDKNKYSKLLVNLNKNNPPAGITISIGSSKDLLGHSGITFTPICERICGIVQPTKIDPSLAPKGKHLMLTHQIVKSKDIKKEIELGVIDLYNIFPEFDKYCEILCTHSFYNDWPVNYLTPDKDLPNITQIENLFMVGDGNKTNARIMTEGVAHGVRQVTDTILFSENS
ncbi:Putative thiazole biosynthetic enzyme [uncultured archaeon]|nr:Putative thiazole biosynthetic enzyme [uncultured archaeon]